MKRNLLLYFTRARIQNFVAFNSDRECYRLDGAKKPTLEELYDSNEKSVKGFSEDELIFHVKAAKMIDEGDELIIDEESCGSFGCNGFFFFHNKIIRLMAR